MSLIEFKKSKNNVIENKLNLNFYLLSCFLLIFLLYSKIKYSISRTVDIRTVYVEKYIITSETSPLEWYPADESSFFLIFPLINLYFNCIEKIKSSVNRTMADTIVKNYLNELTNQEEKEISEIQYRFIWDFYKYYQKSC